MTNLSFFDRIKNAITNFSFSNQVINEPTRKAFKYFLLLILCIALVQSGVFAVKTAIGLRILGTELDKEVPYFELSNGVLSVDMRQPFIVNTEDFYLVIDPMDSMELDAIKKQTVKNIFVIHSKSMKMHYQRTAGQDFTVSYEDVPFDFTKQDLIDFLTDTGRIPFAFFLVSFVLIFLGKLFGTLMAWIFASLTASFKKVRLFGGQTYALALYALTLPSLLKGVIRIFGANVPYFTVIYYIIVGLYLTKYMDALGTPPDETTVPITDGSFVIE